MEWDESNVGYYIITIYWDCPEGRPQENFTFENASAYFDNGDAIENTVVFAEGFSPENENVWRYVLQVKNTAGDSRDGQFTVDIWLRAAGEGGTPHYPTENHPIYYSGIDVAESSIVSETPSPITIRVHQLTEVAYPSDVADVYVQGDSQGEFWQPQLKFDISDVPSGAIIDSVKLWLYRTDGWEWETEDMYVYRVDNQTWDEKITTSEFDAQTLENQETRTVGWSSNGWDYVDVENQFLPDYDAGNTYATIRLKYVDDDSSASDYIYDTSELNLGSEEIQFFRIFYSKDHDGHDPYLEVEYTISIGSSSSSKTGDSSPSPKTGHVLGTENLDKLSIGIRHQMIQRADNETIKVIIRLEPADLRGVSKALTVNTLEEHANKIQGQITEFLPTRDAKVLNKFWLVNAILAEVKVSTIRWLTSLPMVERIHEDFEIKIFEPTGFPTGSTPEDNGITWGLRRIGAEDVWALGIDGSGVRVAVIDTGVDIANPDLENKMWTDNSEDPTYPGGWIRFDEDGNIVMDSTPTESAMEPFAHYGHGTRTSGIVVGDNASGTAIGVAPDAWLMHALCLPHGSGTFSQCLAGMEWVIAPTDQYGNPAGEQADVVNMSFGSYGYWREFIDPIRNMVAAGVVPVAGIGNGGVGLTGSPGNVYEAFGVGAIDNENAVPSFSSGEVVDWPVFHPEPYIKPDFSAPGVDVYSSLPGNEWGYASGTSMAAPHVAGTIALMLDANDNLTVNDIYYVLRETSDDNGAPGKDNRYGWGIINAFDATVMVQLTSGIQGYVKDVQTSEEIVGAKVVVQEKGWTRYTDENGYYKIFSPPGIYRLTVSAFGYYDTDNILAIVFKNRWTTKNIELTPLPTGFISGKVTDNALNPIENAAITSIGAPLSTMTDENGDYILEAPIDSYDIKASAWGFESAFAYDIEVVENLTTQENFELKSTKKVPPIYINSNSDFTPSNGVTSGAGTANDPFILECWEIDMPKVHGIKIRNTDAYFVIENVYVRGRWLPEVTGIYLDNVKNGRIENSLIENRSWGIELLASSNNTISNNILQGTYDRGRHGIIFARSDNNTIFNNIIENRDKGIFVRSSTNNTISSNVIKNNYDGIYLRKNSRNNTISANVIIGRWPWRSYCVTLNESSNNDLLNNVIKNAHTGIIDTSCSNNTFSNNIIQKNVTGIFLPLSSKEVILNNVIENSREGIYLSSSTNNTISNNTISYNDLGIFLSGSNNNLFCYNNFVNNENQAHDDGSNYWDNGYPSGGNYWSDYAGEDNYWGENQDTTGRDGIGDTPRYILGDSNRDRYPFMNPPLFVKISATPSSQSDLPGENLSHDIIVTNIGTENDNYVLDVTDTAGWNRTLSENEFKNVPPGENRGATLTVTIPENSTSFTKDYILLTAISQDNAEVIDADVCVAEVWGIADFKLENMYALSLDTDLYLGMGSKLVVKFYDYSDVFENESVFENFASPAHIVKFEKVDHPEGIGVKKVRLDLTTDNTENVISTMRSFVVRKSNLMVRISQIKGRWPFADAAEKSDLILEISDIKGQWPFAPY